MPHTTELNNHLHLLRSGTPEAKEQLIEYACERLRRLTRRMLKSFPKVGRWNQTDDVLQSALMRLHKSLDSVQPTNPAQFYGLAATQIRRELLDLAKHFYGPLGHGANHLTDTGSIVLRQQDQKLEPENLSDWTHFHEEVEKLPEDQRKVVEILWYDGMNQTDAAKVLGISLATLKRRWAAARLALCEVLEDWTID